MKRHVVLISLVIFLGLAAATAGPPAITRSQADTCPQVVQRALDVTGELCAGAARNEACYGHTALEARPQPFVSAFDFSDEGDIVAVEQIRSLRLSAMNLDAATWGVALLRLRAGLPQAQPDQNVTLLLFGDVELANAAEEVPTATVTINIQGRVNVRQRPSSRAFVLGTVGPDDAITATGRRMVAGDEWVRVELPATGATGWIVASLLTETDASATLEVVEAASHHYGPMQAFTFHSGTGDAPCPEAPDSGLLIQTPEGEARVTFLINEVAVQLGSTVYFQAQPGEAMTVSVIEGSAVADSDNGSSVARAGMQFTVPLNDALAPSGPPSLPRPYALEDVAALPVQTLPRTVEIAPPAQPDEVAEVVESLAPGALPPVSNNGPAPDGAVYDDGTVAEDDTVTNAPAPEFSSEAGETGDDDGDGDNGDDDLPPGLIDNPGLGDNLPPGHGGAPPGQSKKD